MAPKIVTEVLNHDGVVTVSLQATLTIEEMQQLGGEKTLLRRLKTTFKVAPTKAQLKQLYAFLNSPVAEVFASREDHDWSTTRLYATIRRASAFAQVHYLYELLIRLEGAEEFEHTAAGEEQYGLRRFGKGSLRRVRRLVSEKVRELGIDQSFLTHETDIWQLPGFEPREEVE